MSWIVSLRQIDFELFQQINGWAGRYVWLDAVGVFVSEYLVFIIGVCVVWIALRHVLHRETVVIHITARKWFFPGGNVQLDGGMGTRLVSWWRGITTLFSAMIAAGGGYFLRVHIGRYFARVRPFSRDIDVMHLSSNLQDASFPSGHATIAFALAFSVAWAYPGAGCALIALAALVAAGRVYTGVHYPGDVVGGMVLGLFCALMSRIIVHAFARGVHSKLKSQYSKLQFKS